MQSIEPYRVPITFKNGNPKQSHSVTNVYLPPSPLKKAWGSVAGASGETLDDFEVLCLEKHPKSQENLHYKDWSENSWMSKNQVIQKFKSHRINSQDKRQHPFPTRLMRGVFFELFVRGKISAYMNVG